MNNLPLIAKTAEPKTKAAFMQKLGSFPNAKLRMAALLVEAAILTSGCVGSEPQKLVESGQIVLANKAAVTNFLGLETFARMGKKAGFAASTATNAALFFKMPSTVKSALPAQAMDIRLITDVKHMLSRQDAVHYFENSSGVSLTPDLKIDTASRTSQIVFSNGKFLSQGVGGGKLEIGHANWSRGESPNELGYDSASVTAVISSSYLTIQNSNGVPVFSYTTWDDLAAIGKLLGAENNTGAIYYSAPGVNTMVDYFVIAYKFTAYAKNANNDMTVVNQENQVFAIPKSLAQGGTQVSGALFGPYLFLVRQNTDDQNVVYSEYLGILPGLSQIKDGNIVDIEKPFDIEFFAKKTIPTSFKLEQNYPNPFNPSTTIRYDLPAQASVSVKIYNSAGQEVASHANEVQTAGSHEIRFNAANFPSGTYFFRMFLDNKPKATEKIMLVK